MKTNVQRLVLLSILIAISMFVQAQMEYGVVFEESFENGTPADSGWTQEYSSVKHDWVVESGNLLRPNGAYEGAKRIALRNGTTTTIGYKTKLVSPIMDLSKLFQPILKFAHAQDQWTGDFDTLRVYYRTDTTRDWSPLPSGEYTHYISKWQYETIVLSGQSATYQIAFEGTDNMGRGIVLDDIMVRSTPNCLQPYSFRQKVIANNTATFSWEGPFDAEKFLIKVHTDSIPAEKLDTAKASAFDDAVDNDWTFEKKITGLEAGKTYYAYVKSICPIESSTWSEGFALSTSNIENVPYAETFNKEYNPGFYARLSSWTYGASEGSETPYINVGNKETTLIYWSRDTTTALMFTGHNYDSRVLDVGDYTYCATPEMNVGDISTLQVSFWGRYQSDYADHYKLIVGVMTNPQDISSFVHVDTVEITKYREFQEFVVTLSSYQGKGKYIGLLAQFSEGDNQFYLDDFKVETIPSCRKAHGIEISQKTATQATISWSSDGATNGDIVLSDTAVDITALDAQITYANVLNGHEVTGLKPWSEYYIYVRNICAGGKGEWSNADLLLTPDTILSLPHLCDFKIDENDPSTYYVPGADGYYKLSAGLITLYNDNKDHPYVDEIRDGDTWEMKSVLAVFAKEKAKYAYIVFPELPNIKETRVEFFAKRDEDYSGAFEVGVMTDVNDIRSFTHVDSIEVGEDNKLCRVNLDQYKGNGKFFAIRVQYNDLNMQGSYVYFENLIFEDIPSCKEPFNIKVEPKDTFANITWEANGALSWEVRLSVKEITEDSLNSTTFSDYLYDAIVTSPSVSFANLLPNQTRYYYYIKPICGNESGNWTLVDYFQTDCLYGNTIPYFMDFEGYPTGEYQKEFAVPCYVTEMVNHYSENYPYISDFYVCEGEAALFLSASHDGPKHYDYMTLPEMGDTLKELQMSFILKSPKTTTQLHVGIMADPTDRSTFDSLYTVSVNKAFACEDFTLPFSKYEGEGKYIAFRMADNEEGEFYIDNINVDYKSSCAKVHSPKLISTTDSSAIISWAQGDDETKWNLIVSTSENLTIEQCNKAIAGTYTEGIAFAGVANSNPFTVENLKPVTAYYFYVQARCTDLSYGDWSSLIGQFRTDCIAQDTYKTGVENFDTYGTGNGVCPPCWIVGNQTDPSEVFAPQCSDEYSHSGSASLHIRSFLSQNGAYAISSMIDIDNINNLQVSFWGSCTEKYAKPQYQQQLVIGVVTSPSDLSSFMPIDTITGYADEQYYTISLSNYDGDHDEKQGKYVMFLSEFGKNNYFFIDDVRFDTIPECQYPDGIEMEALTHDSIAISWNTTSTAPYDVKISTRQLSEEELNAATNPVDATVFEISNIAEEKAQYKGLSPNTKYFLYIASICNGEKSWSPAIRFKSGCLPSYPIPFKEDFNSYTQAGKGFNPDCWTSYYSVLDEEKDYPHIYKYGNTGYGLSVSASPDEAGAKSQSYAVTPRLDVEDMSKCQVSFWAKPSNSTAQRNVIVGVASDVSVNDSIVSTFVAVDTIKIVSKTYNKYRVPLTKYAGDGKYVVFTTAAALNLSTSYDAGVYIDDIEIDTIPSCLKPDAVTVEDISSDYVVFSILGGNTNVPSWSVEYGASGFTLGTGTEIAVNSRDFKLLSLTSRTSYHVYVRATCSEKDKSEWFGPISVSTIGTPVSEYPYTHSFEDDTENLKWTFLNDEVNAWHIGDDHSKDGRNALYISKDNSTAEYNTGKTSDSWVVRPVKLQKGEYTFSFKWVCAGESNYDYLKIGLLPTTATFAAGSNIVLQGDGTETNMAPNRTPSQWLSLEGAQRNKLNGVETWESNSVSYTIEEEAVYNLVLFWTNDGSGGKSKPSAAVDSINITYSDCLKPSMLKTDMILDTAATISWSNAVAAATSWEVFVTPNGKVKSPEETIAVGDTTLQNTVTISNISLENLAPKTKYYVFVRTLCGENVHSSWSDAHEFKTDCPIYEFGESIFGFEESEAHYIPMSEYKVPECFEIGNINKGLELGAVDYPHVAESNADEKYSRQGDYSLGFASYKAETNGSYITLPEVNEDMDSLQVTFWMRPFYHFSSGGMNIRYAGPDYAKTLTIGTMESPSDTGSFVKVIDVVYPYGESDMIGKTIDSDPSGNQYWRKYIIPITVKSGKHIVFMNSYDKNLMYIDDVTIEKVSSCVTPHTLRVNTTTDTSAVIAFDHTGGVSWDIIISDTKEFVDTIVRKTTPTGTLSVNGLNPNSRYYAKVQQLCEEDERSNWSTVTEFQTSMSVRFFEDFNTTVRVPENWARASALASKVFEGSSRLSYYANTVSSGWNYSSENVFIDGHQKMSIPASKRYDWILTPTVSIGNAPNVHLTFDLALTDDNRSTPPLSSDLEDSDGNPYTDNMFMVIISEDGGDTWKEENATVWNNFEESKGNKSFNSISHTGEQVNIDLSKYVNKQIKVAFYGQSLVENATVDLHVDNININHFDSQILNDNLCQTESYDRNGFDIPSSDISTGENTFSRYKLAAIEAPDTVYNLTLTVKPMVETEIEATVCEGEVYGEYDFSTSKLGHHQHKLKADNGCDSVVNLNLSLIPIVKTIVEDTICQGGNYTFNDSVYGREGVYIHTLKSNVTFCDSIVTLILTVKEAVVTEVSEVLCFGDSIDFGKYKNIRTSGTYKDTFQTATTCDSIVLLTVEALPVLDTVIFATICDGEVYNENGFKGIEEAGSYPNVIKTDDDCDSLVTLNLTVIGRDTVPQNVTITTKDLPYTYVDDKGNEGNTFDVGTQPGVYKDTITVSAGECEGVIILTLTIELGVSVDNIAYTPFSITPNPIKVGESVSVEIAGDLNIVSCEVYDATGALITSFSPNSNPIILKDFKSRGIYMIRVTADTGEVFVGKVLVK